MLEIKSWQKQLVLETPIQANAVRVEATNPDLESAPRDAVPRADRFLARGRGRSMKLKVQCQICNRLGHLAQKCYYRFYRLNGEATFLSPVLVPTPMRFPSNHMPLGAGYG